MKKEEKQLCEAIESYLQDESKLGLPEATDEESHTLQFLHEQINEMFALKVIGMTHQDGMRSAFRKVHNYKYLTDPTFNEALRKELSAQAVPREQQDKAFEYVNQIIEQIRKEDSIGDERDAGYNDNLEEILKAHKEDNRWDK